MGGVETRTDPTGHETMSPAMEEMQAYPAYLFKLISQHLGERVLEIGVGYGTYTRMLLEQGCHVRATDIDDQCVERVMRRFASEPELSTGLIDLTNEPSIRIHSDFRADTIVCLNVLEHIQEDRRALELLRDVVVPGAKLLLIVPAHQQLYGKMDAEAGHYRRYSRRVLRDTLQAAGWSVVNCRYCNIVGMLGWWYHNRVRKDAGLKDEHVNHQMRTADKWLPRFARFTDPLCGRLAGLSVLAVARNE